MTALCSRRVNVSAMCPVCNLETETDFHALVTCSIVKQVWCRTSVGDTSRFSSSLEEWWIKLNQRHFVEDVAVGAMIIGVRQQHTNGYSVAVKWQKSGIGYVKCNMDASIYLTKGNIAFGMVTRDADGRFLEARNGLINAIMDPLLAEALSCREALSWLKTAGKEKVLVEYDCQCVKWCSF
ncbi:conserved hypothetical protein [Ricinus communis]|uniref:RNase H type-1 domain-containing protein n=1 Tax=Ricinus communis TaxID=3988 RepID=B9SJL6_RICCO|nr:conserved hypothetical protein [Ricinus communis]